MKKILIFSLISVLFIGCSSNSESGGELIVVPIFTVQTKSVASIGHESANVFGVISPSFVAGTNRLTPPTVAAAGPLVDFTHSLGVLTYTGARTRSFRINYNITITTGASGANMTVFNSINSGLVISTTQAQQRYQVTVSINAMQVCFSIERYSGII